MRADAAQTWPGADELRRVVALFAAAVAVLAAVADPAGALDVALGAVPVAAFLVWASAPRVPLWAVSVSVIAPVVLAQRSGGLEPLLFDVALLAFVVGRWSPSIASAAALGLLALLAPVAVSVIQDPSEIAVGIWLLGIAFPWVVARGMVRQAQLAQELAATQRELAEQARLEERRQIARDVHDFVGHGLAAVMLQVTSARHVLRRDPAAAEEALLSAEAVGRRSMDELRRTVGLLRSDDEQAARAPVPMASEIPALIDHAQAGGLAVELRLRGDLAQIAPAVGLALYRIAQEALANAARHAPHARTVLELELADGRVELLADTTGPTAPPAPDQARRPQYGLIGMRERAMALGGELSAGPTRRGWRVSCRLPLAPQGR